MGNLPTIGQIIRNNLQPIFFEFSQSYSLLYKSIERQPITLSDLPPFGFRLPAVEFFNGTNVVNSIGITGTENEDLELEEERQVINDEIRRETEDRLELLLTSLNQELTTPLQGARQILKSNNPERVRYFSTSLRELFTQVLHLLAPDERVKMWNTDPVNYDRGRPTRRARLLYICRDLNQDSFSTFVEKDIDTVLSFLQLFQQGTHEVTSKYSDFQLRIMLTRMESTLRFLLEIWQAGKHT
jgi:hypothetical protein